MKHEELLTLVAQLSAANLKLRETIKLQRDRLEEMELRLAGCCGDCGGCDCTAPDDCDGRCQAQYVD